MANAIVDEDTGVAMNCRKFIKKPKLRPFGIKYFANGIGRISQGVGGRAEGTDTMF